MRGPFRVLMTLALVLAATSSSWAADAPTLEERAAAIELASKAPDGDRVVVGHISRKLTMSVETLRNQRASTGLGWGGILIANRLTRATGLPLEQIVTEFRGGKSWEDIAREHGADLRMLTAEIERSQEVVEHRAEDRAPHTDGPAKPLPSKPADGRAWAPTFPGLGSGVMSPPGGIPGQERR